MNLRELPKFQISLVVYQKWSLQGRNDVPIGCKRCRRTVPRALPGQSFFVSGQCLAEGNDLHVRLACHDPNITRRLRITLQQLGVEWTDFYEPPEPLPGDTPVLDNVVLIGAPLFNANELARVNDLIQTCDNDTRFVAVGPPPEPALLIELMQVGVSGFVDSTSNMEVELRRQFDRTAAGRNSRNRLGKLIIVIPTSGGAGSSFLATNIAAGITRRQQSCCLLDLKSGGGDLATILGLTPRHTAASLAAKSDQIDRVMFDQSLILHECGLSLLAGSDAYSDAPALTPAVIHRILQVARSRFSQVVVELDAVHETEMMRVLLNCDRIILPLRLDFTALRRVRKLLDRFEQAKLPTSLLMVVATRCGEPMELPVHSANESLSVPISHQIPYAPAAIHESINLGQPLVIAAPQSRLAATVLRIVDTLVMKPDEARQKSRSLLNLFRMTPAHT